jgi:hypothetical protein
VTLIVAKAQKHRRRLYAPFLPSVINKNKALIFSARSAVAFERLGMHQTVVRQAEDEKHVRVEDFFLLFPFWMLPS